MFVALLTFKDKSKAPALMAGHNAWLADGFEAGHFWLSGSLQPGLGGAVMFTAADRVEAEAILARDPFVSEGVVQVDLHEISPSRAIPELERMKA